MRDNRSLTGRVEAARTKTWYWSAVAELAAPAGLEAVAEYLSCTETPAQHGQTCFFPQVWEAVGKDH